MDAAKCREMRNESARIEAQKALDKIATTDLSPLYEYMTALYCANLCPLWAMDMVGAEISKRITSDE